LKHDLQQYSWHECSICDKGLDIKILDKTPGADDFDIGWHSWRSDLHWFEWHWILQFLRIGWKKAFPLNCEIKKYAKLSSMLTWIHCISIMFTFCHLLWTC